MPLVTVSHPAVRIDLRYASANNLTSRPIYDRAIALLRPEAMECLARAADLTREIGLALCVHDAYRPIAAQWRLWEFCPDPDFVADPRIGSSHQRGVAVDLTLCRPDGAPLDMGTAFDEMVPRSHHGVTGLGAEAQANRALLLGIMVGAGWEHLPSEWWHFNLPEPRRFPMIEDGACGIRLMEGGLA